MAKQRRGFPALVFNKEDELFYRGKIKGTLQKGDNGWGFYNVRLNGDDEDIQVDRDDVEFRGGAVPWRDPKPGDRVLVEPISRPDRTYSFPTSWSNNLIGEKRSTFVEGVVKRLPRPTEEIRRYHVVVHSGNKRKTLHVSRHQIKPLGANIEEEPPNTAPPKATNTQQEQPQMKDKKVQRTSPVSIQHINLWVQSQKITDQPLHHQNPPTFNK